MIKLYRKLIDMIFGKRCLCVHKRVVTRCTSCEELY